MQSYVCANCHKQPQAKWGLTVVWIAAASVDDLFLTKTGFAFGGFRTAGGLFGPMGFVLAFWCRGSGALSEGGCPASAAALTACNAVYAKGWYMTW